MDSQARRTVQTQSSLSSQQDSKRRGPGGRTGVRGGCSGLKEHGEGLVLAVARGASCTRWRWPVGGDLAHGTKAERGRRARPWPS